MTNVVLHAYPPDTAGTMTVALRVERGRLSVSVADSGRWRTRDGGHDGRGLRIIRALAPVADIGTGPEGSVVVLAWPLP